MEIPERYAKQVWCEIHYTNEKGEPVIVGFGPPYFPDTDLGEVRMLEEYRKLKGEHSECSNWRVYFYSTDDGKRRLISIPANFG